MCINRAHNLSLVLYLGSNPFALFPHSLFKSYFAHRCIHLSEQKFLWVHELSWGLHLQMEIGRKTSKFSKCWLEISLRARWSDTKPASICSSQDLWQYSMQSLLYFKKFCSSYLDIAWKILLHFQSTARWEKGHDQSYQQKLYLKILTNKLHLQ